MLEAYSENVAVAVSAPIPFNSTSLIKGCTVTHPSPDTVNLNKCGVYMISVDASAETAATIQLFKDGVAQPQAQSTGTSVSFVTLVQVDHNNSRCCACDSPTTIQIRNLSSAEATFANCNICVTKII